MQQYNNMQLFEYVHDIYIYKLCSSRKRRWKVTEDSGGPIPRTLDLGFQAARDGDLEQLHLGWIEVRLLQTFDIWEVGFSRDFFSLIHISCFFSYRCPLVFALFLVVSAQFRCETPAMFVAGATWSSRAGTWAPWTGTATVWSTGPRAADMWRCLEDVFFLGGFNRLYRHWFNYTLDIFIWV